jgi:hypothetical protein
VSLGVPTVGQKQTEDRHTLVCGSLGRTSNSNNNRRSLRDDKQKGQATTKDKD